MAEHADSRAVVFVTLTYGEGYHNPAAYVLDKEHLSRFVRNLRALGHVVKPVAAGEYGSKEERAHWHVLLFFKTEPPTEWIYDQRSWPTYKTRRGDRRYWPHGHMYVERPRSTQACAAYILSYLDKAPGKRGEFHFPKRPAIGEPYLMRYAREKAKAGLALFPKNQPTYTVEGNVKNRGPSAGQPYDYWLDIQSPLFDRMIIEYCREWAVTQRREMPYDRLVATWAARLSISEGRKLRPDPIRQTVEVVQRMQEMSMPERPRYLYMAEEMDLQTRYVPEWHCAALYDVDFDGGDPVWLASARNPEVLAERAARITWDELPRRGRL